jgi:hypothetical protein
MKEDTLSVSELSTHTTNREIVFQMVSLKKEVSNRKITTLLLGCSCADTCTFLWIYWHFSSGPRQLSDIGVAERLAEESAEKTGNTVGYLIRLESKMSPSTQFLFCITGLFLRTFNSEPHFIFYVSHHST